VSQTGSKLAREASTTRCPAPPPAAAFGRRRGEVPAGASGSFPSEFRAGLRHAFLVPVLVLSGAFIRTFTLASGDGLDFPKNSSTFQTLRLVSYKFPKQLVRGLLHIFSRSTMCTSRFRIRGPSMVSRSLLYLVSRVQAWSPVVSALQ